VSKSLLKNFLIAIALGSYKLHYV